MADNENFREETNHWYLVLGAAAFIGVALLPVVLRVIQLFA